MTPAAPPAAGDLPLPDLEAPGGDLAFVLGVLFNQQIRAETAWAGPGRLAERLGGLDVDELADADPARLQDAMRQAPAVHPFTETMTGHVIGICRLLAAGYDARAAALWDDLPSAQALVRRLTALPGIGPHKAGVALALLTGPYQVPLGDGPGLWEAVDAATTHCPRLREVLMT